MERDARAPQTPTSPAADSDDDIVMRIPVHLQPSGDDTKLCLFQYPLRPRWRPYQLSDLTAARVRPHQGRVELTLGMECSPAHYDHESDVPLHHIQLASTSNNKHPTSYAIAMLQMDEDGAPTALSLSPLSTTIQLRPSFAQLDAQLDASADASAKATPTRGGGLESASLPDEYDEDMEDDEDDDGLALVGEDEATKLSTVNLLRPAQTEREIEARRSSHAFLVEEREKELWSKAHMHAPESAASVAKREQCFGMERS